MIYPEDIEIAKDRIKSGHCQDGFVNIPFHTKAGNVGNFKVIATEERIDKLLKQKIRRPRKVSAGEENTVAKQAQWYVDNLKGSELTFYKPTGSFRSIECQFIYLVLSKLNKHHVHFDKRNDRAYLDGLIEAAEKTGYTITYYED